MQTQPVSAQNIHPLDFDAFSHGQISSKLWLCENLESYFKDQEKPLSIAVYGSWIGLLPFLMLSRGRLKIRQFDLYDIDPKAKVTAQKILDFWKFVPDLKIHFHTQDCNDLLLTTSETDLVINTSCEHMENLAWWKNVPNESYFCLQSTNMQHHTHVNIAKNLETWQQSLDLKPLQVHYSGEQYVSYGTFSFSRWMLLGKK